MHLTLRQERKILNLSSKAKRAVIALFRGTGLTSEEKEPIGHDVEAIVDDHIQRIMRERARYG